MKKFLSVLIALAMLLTMFGAVAIAETKAGTYEGTGVSQIGGELKVAVTVGEDGTIADVQVVSHNDTPGICDAAVSGIPSEIVAQQSLAVDAVAGATMTSNAILEAATAALTAAGADIDALMVKKEVVVEQAADVELEADVVIIGRGRRGPCGRGHRERGGQDRHRAGEDAEGRRQHDPRGRRAERGGRPQRDGDRQQRLRRVAL